MLPSGPEWLGGLKTAKSPSQMSPCLGGGGIAGKRCHFDATSDSKKAPNSYTSIRDLIENRPKFFLYGLTNCSKCFHSQLQNDMSNPVYRKKKQLYFCCSLTPTFQVRLVFLLQLLLLLLKCNESFKVIIVNMNRAVSLLVKKG